MKTRLTVAAFLLSSCSAPLFGSDIIRHKAARVDAPIAQAVEVPSGHALVFLSGVGPDVADKRAAKGSVAAYGDTGAQTLDVLRKIEANLQSIGLGMKDVIKMQVFLAGDPARGGDMDFAGMTAAYRKFFGTAEQPDLPARSTVKVAGLVQPGWLIEIEVTAVRKADPMGCR
jgi:enamine deaminase RidA (YjgF/YER057c/UK114 family)